MRNAFSSLIYHSHNKGRSGYSMKTNRRRYEVCARCLLAFGFAGLLSGGSLAHGQTAAPISGLAWADENTLIAVHDAKSPSENNKPRVSLITVPKAGDQFKIDYINIEWPSTGGHSSDLEAVAAIPGTPLFIAAESGQDSGKHKRLFLLKYDHHKLQLMSHVDWPVDVRNVEAMTITKIGRNLFFFFAERADGKTTTKIRWAELKLDPLKFGSFSETKVARPEPTGSHSRAVADIAFDTAGAIYISSTYDEGDNGPFNSCVWRVGQIATAADDQPNVTITEQPELIERFPGTKVEGVAIHTLANGNLEMLLGSDNENKGGQLIRVPIKK